MALSDREGLEEERRLVYVAATRARDALTVAYPLRYHHRRHGHDDAHSFAQLSRFLEPARPAFDAEGIGGAPDDEPAANPATLDPVPDLLSGLWSA